MSLEIDHLFCFVDPGADWARRALEAGWLLDDGVEHVGQGTRNRRLWLAEQYVELIWLSSRTDAANHPLRLDRRADWRTTGACPFGLGLRGQLDEELRAEFWEYRPPYARDSCIWVHRSSEAAPLVFVLEGSAVMLERLQPRIRLADKPDLLAHSRPATIHRVNLRTPVAIQGLLANVTPRIHSHIGIPQSLEIIMGNSSCPVLKLTEELSLIGCPAVALGG
ncbi:MAG: VOC family protein [Myxococcota bacterium]|nr:VOC family protein [Myxococcota bacterium]